MAGRRKAPLWRQTFLRGLKRTGNVRVSAFEAGVDPGTAYDHRTKDAGFRAKWVAAKAAFDARKKQGRPSPQPRSRPPDGTRPAGGRGGKEDLVLRRTKHGDKLVRAATGRWSGEVEARFFEGLEQTGCVRSAARAAGVSTQALYERCKHYPEFGARWREIEARAKTQLPHLLRTTALNALSADGADRPRGRPPRLQLDAGHAVRLALAAEKAGTGESGPFPGRDPEAEKEALVQTLSGLFDMLKRRQETARRADGWTDAGKGIWLPPGWTVQPPPDGDEAGQARPE